MNRGMGVQLQVENLASELRRPTHDARAIMHHTRLIQQFLREYRRGDHSWQEFMSVYEDIMRRIFFDRYSPLMSILKEKDIGHLLAPPDTFTGQDGDLVHAVLRSHDQHGDRIEPVLFEVEHMPLGFRLALENDPNRLAHLFNGTDRLRNNDRHFAMPFMHHFFACFCWYYVTQRVFVAPKMKKAGSLPQVADFKPKMMPFQSRQKLLNVYCKHFLRPLRHTNGRVTDEAEVFLSMICEFWFRQNPERRKNGLKEETPRISPFIPDANLTNAMCSVFDHLLGQIEPARSGQLTPYVDKIWSKVFQNFFEVIHLFPLHRMEKELDGTIKAWLKFLQPWKCGDGAEKRFSDRWAPYVRANFIFYSMVLTEVMLLADNFDLSRSYATQILKKIMNLFHDKALLEVLDECNQYFRRQVTERDYDPRFPDFRLQIELLLREDHKYSWFRENKRADCRDRDDYFRQQAHVDPEFATDTRELRRYKTLLTQASAYRESVERIVVKLHSRIDHLQVSRGGVAYAEARRRGREAKDMSTAASGKKEGAGSKQDLLENLVWDNYQLAQDHMYTFFPWARDKVAAWCARHLRPLVPFLESKPRRGKRKLLDNDDRKFLSLSELTDLLESLEAVFDVEPSSLQHRMTPSGSRRASSIASSSSGRRRSAVTSVGGEYLGSGSGAGGESVDSSYRLSRSSGGALASSSSWLPRALSSVSPRLPDVTEKQFLKPDDLADGNFRIPAADPWSSPPGTHELTFLLPLLKWASRSISGSSPTALQKVYSRPVSLRFVADWRVFFLMLMMILYVVLPFTWGCVSFLVS